MTPQEPAVGIMKTGDFGNARFYKVECSCGNPDDNVEFEIEADDFGITLNTFFTPKSPSWAGLVDSTGSFDSSWLWGIDYSIRSLINGLHHRVKVTWEVWTKGYVKCYQTTIMSEQQAFNYGSVLIQSISDLKELKKQGNGND